MDERKRRSPPLGDGSEGHAAQKRRLSTLGSIQVDSAGPEDEGEKSQLDAALGLDDGFLEVS